MRSSTPLRVLRLTALLAVVALPGSAYAQGDDTRIRLRAAEECLASIPSSALARVPVFASAARARSAMPKALYSAFLRHAATVVQEIADRTSTLLGGTPGTLPQGEPSISWRDLERELLVTWYRNGRVAWRVQDDSSRGSRGSMPPSRDGGAQLLARALAALAAEGAAFFPWPPGIAADSASFLIEYRRFTIDEAGKMHPVTDAPLAVPVFSIAAPRETGAAQRSAPRISYPPRMLSMRIEGTVILQFIVDTTGRADLSTVRDVWSEDRARLTGESSDAYWAFFREARAGLGTVRYMPARIGGCPVPQLVEQPFSFAIRQ